MSNDEKTAQSSAPPRGVMVAIKLARIGEFKDEYEDFFLLAYQEKVQKRGEVFARRWAYRHAAKTLFFAVVEWAKFFVIMYLKLAGR